MRAIRRRLPQSEPACPHAGCLRATYRAEDSPARIRGSLAAAAVSTIIWFGGCQAPGPIFPLIDPPIVWPPPPDRPRIRYVGELTGEKSLRAPRSGWAALRAAITGEPGTVAFSTPTAVAVHGSRVYVADGQLRAVHVLDLETRAYATIVEADGAPLEWPNDVDFGGGQLFISDALRAAAFVYDDAGRYVRTIGKGVLQRPAAVVWCPVEATVENFGRVCVIDAAAHACMTFSADGTLMGQLGRRGAGTCEFNYPSGAAFKPGVGSAIVDSMNFRVQLGLPFDAATIAWAGANPSNTEIPLVRIIGQKGDAAGDFSLPRDAAFDSDGHLYVLDSQFENVQVFDRDGRLLMAFGQEGHGPGEFYLPSGITIDTQDRIWIADTYNRRVQVFEYLRERVE